MSAMRYQGKESLGYLVDRFCNQRSCPDYAQVNERVEHQVEGIPQVKRV